ncbi:carbohydrate kinase [Lentilactobacillus buchneri]|uniref:FGGY-family carbohydrate kinase n=1 Tax=Lentilactobacillus buchneri TaxID=1581 RepID=UPI0021A890CD|nr:FGGY-family carbohydrate kinase [Lentilactobacillus buchneri]MCT3557320.1 carbohydrate kinase [Lentilactobacillus buchneri]MCT3563252.1 carbohydrate kinase [Lentilactobacillus buchneri]
MIKYFLTIDNGGTNTKAIVFNDHGDQMGSVAFPTPRIEEQAGFHEIDLNESWSSISNAINQVIAKSGITNDEIAGVSCVGHGKGLYALDKDHQIFMHGILSTDSRALSLAEKFENKVSNIYAISHQHVMETQSPVILRWLKDHQRENYDQIGTILAAKDYIRFRLTDNVNQEYGDASGNNFVDLEKQEYSKELFDFFGIPEMFDKMPPLKRFSDFCGGVTSQAAKETGLKEGTPVYAGMFDIDACSLATGVLNDDYFSSIVGTWNINVFPSKVRADQDSGLMNSIYPTGSNLVEASSATSAGNLDIMIKTLMSEEIKNATAHSRSIYDVLEEFLDHTDATFTKIIFFPFLYGSNVAPDAEGSFIGIQSSTTKSAMIRSVYEGIIFAHRYHIEKLLKVAGHKPKAIRISGGGTNSKAWVQMFADVLALPIETVKGSELGGLGGAMASAVGTGLYANIDEAVKHMSQLKDRVEPDEQQYKIYTEKYNVYLDLLHTLDHGWAKLRDMQERIGQL